MLVLIPFVPFLVLLDQIRERARPWRCRCIVLLRLRVRLWLIVGLGGVYHDFPSRVLRDYPDPVVLRLLGRRATVAASSAKVRVYRARPHRSHRRDLAADDPRGRGCPRTYPLAGAVTMLHA